MKERELEHVATSSSNDTWMDLAEAMEKPVDLIYEFHHWQEKAEKAEIYSGEEKTKPFVKEEVLQPVWKEDKSSVVKKKLQKPEIIDLDTYEEAQEPDNSMALVVVPQPPQAQLSNAELAIVRLDTTQTSGTMVQSGIDHEQSRIGSNQSIANVCADRPSPGNSLTVSAAGLQDGTRRWASSKVGILTVQCARCLKWRVVPSREMYEAIREHILETPWVCENALQWRSDAHCDLPSDLSQDSQTLWAIDKPNLPSSPPGWSRRVIVRKDGSTRFADVYYTAPDGKNLRSMVEVAKYLEENPGSVPVGTHLNQFSYTTPQPLPGVWTAKKRKRSVDNLLCPQGKGKKDRAPESLPNQQAQRLLHSSSTFWPIPPSFPGESAALFQPPGAATFAGPVLPQTVQQTLTFPGPVVPQSVQPLAMQLHPYYPPVPEFRNPPDVPLPSSILLSSYPVAHSDVAIPGEDSFSYFQQRLLASNARRPDSSTVTASGGKEQKQKSRLRGATATDLGILPLRDPNGV